MPSVQSITDGMEALTVSHYTYIYINKNGLTTISRGQFGPLYFNPG